MSKDHLLSSTGTKVVYMKCGPCVIFFCGGNFVLSCSYSILNRPTLKYIPMYLIAALSINISGCRKLAIVSLLISECIAWLTCYHDQCHVIKWVTSKEMTSIEMV